MTAPQFDIVIKPKAPWKTSAGGMCRQRHTTAAR